MPTLARLSNCTITMYAADHMPPHFHVRMNDGAEALVIIATLQILRSNVPERKLSEAMAWARSNDTLLAQKWKELNP